MRYLSRDVEIVLGLNQKLNLCSIGLHKSEEGFSGKHKQRLTSRMKMTATEVQDECIETG